MPQIDDTMNRLPIDEMYLLNPLFGIKELSKEEQNRITIINLNMRPDQISLRPILLLNTRTVAE